MIELTEIHLLTEREQRLLVNPEKITCLRQINRENELDGTYIELENKNTVAVKQSISSILIDLNPLV